MRYHLALIVLDCDGSGAQKRPGFTGQRCKSAYIHNLTHLLLTRLAVGLGKDGSLHGMIRPNFIGSPAFRFRVNRKLSVISSYKTAIRKSIIQNLTIH